MYEALAAPPRGPPIAPLIPPQRQAKITQHGNSKQPPLPRDEAIRAIRRRGQRYWKQHRGYHRRSLAETQMVRYKQLIGPRLRARTLAGQQAESRLGCVVLNRMTHRGRPVSDKVERAAYQSLTEENRLADFFRATKPLSVVSFRRAGGGGPSLVR